MPLEIRELVIKASVGDGTEGALTVSRETNNLESNQTELINACVEQVLAILKEKAER